MLSARPRVPALAPFSVRAFRFQWPADLATSWAFEMETLILGWYVLVETRSVLLLTVFASLQHVGTLIAPIFGVAGDRIGHRKLLCIMRGFYATLATTLMILAFTGTVTPMYVLMIAALMGLVRPSDIGMRVALVGETMPPDRLMGAMAIQRTTQDSARIAGALTGAGMVALLGMGAAYLVVAGLYLTAVGLTWKAGEVSAAPDPVKPHAAPVARTSPWRDLKQGLAYVRRTPPLLAVMMLAFLLNLTAFPLMNGLLPYVAKEVYRADQTTLGWMVAGAATGALVASIALSRFGASLPPARAMLLACGYWYAALLVFANLPTPAGGIIALMLAGCGQSLSQIPMATMLLRTADTSFRGRVMGIRMLAIYGNLPGLLLSGPLIAAVGYPVTASLYCTFGLVLLVVVAVRWREHLWDSGAPANVR